MIEASKSDPVRPAGSSAEDNAPVSHPACVDAILESNLGRGVERFGMVAAVLQGGRIVAQGAAGVRKSGTAERITLEDQFHLGSCTKAMTATLVAMLVEEGKLNWTTTLGELFAGTVEAMHPAWEKVTMRQVLAHRAGLRLDPDGLVRVFKLLFLASCARPRTRPEPRRLEIVRQALQRPPQFPPDTRFYYSNEGYILAGAVLEQLTGSSWDDLMRERLFRPLGITTGGFGPPGHAGKTDQPWGHSSVIGKPVDPGSPAAEFPRYYAPAGLVHMTLADYAKFIGLHLRGDPANPQRQAALLKPDTFAELHGAVPGTTYSKGWVMRGTTLLCTGDAAPAVTYCAGWFISPAGWASGARPGNTGRRFWAGGSNGQWLCAACVAPEIDFAVLIACNRGLDIALWKTRQAVRALTRGFAPTRT